MTNISKRGTRRSWPRILLRLFAALVVLAVVVYFAATSSFCLRHVILPMASKSLGVTVTVSDASISPFSRVVLRQVRVQSTGSEPLFTADEVRLSYHLWQILHGNIHVDEVTVNSAAVQIITNPDGTSNLDPLLKKTASPAPANTPGKPSAPPNLEVVRVALNNASIRMIRNYAGGGRDATVMSNVNIALDNLQNGRSGRLTLTAGIGVDDQPPAPGTNGSLQAKAEGRFTFSLAPDLKPVAINGGMQLDVPEADGAMKDLARLAVALDCEVTSTNINQVTLQFRKGDANLGDVRLSGPLDLEKMEGRLALDVSAIDQRVLNLVAGGNGLDFGQAAINSSNRIELANGGASIAMDGEFDAVKVALLRDGRPVPVVDLHADYGVALNRADGSILLRRLAINGLQNRHPLLRLDLSSPMQLSFGNPGAAGNASLNLAVTDFNLEEWKPFLGDGALGNLSLKLSLLSKPDGRRLAVEANGRVGQYVFDHYGATWDVNVMMTNRHLQVAKASGSIRQAAGSGGTVDFTADYDLDKNSGQLAFNVSGLNQNAFRPFLEPALGGKKLDSVSLSANATAAYSAGGDCSIKAEFQLTNLVVRDPGKKTDSPPLAVGLHLDAALHNQVADLRELRVMLAPTDRATNELALSGRVDLSHPGAISGGLKLAADSLEFTHYYDLLAAKPPESKAAPVPPPPPGTTNTAPAAPRIEPPAMKLPFGIFTFDADIGRIYLHEIEITRFGAAARLDGARLVLQPCGLNLNGAPVAGRADLDLGVPGYKYDVAFSADKIPIAPLADSFSPDYRGRAKGDLVARLQLKGAGVTDLNLRKHLSGSADILLTNAVIALDAGKRVQYAMNVVGAIFELLHLPDVRHSALTLAAVDATVGDGTIKLGKFQAVADEFIVASTGSITLADILTNSTLNDLPVILGLPATAARKANLAPANLDANAAYVQLGRLAVISGTLGAPSYQIDRVAIAALTGKVVLGGAKSVGNEANKLYQGARGFSGILTGANSNNAAATGQSAPSKTVFGTIKSFNPFQKKSATN